MITCYWFRHQAHGFDSRLFVGVQLLLFCSLFIWLIDGLCLFNFHYHHFLRSIVSYYLLLLVRGIIFFYQREKSIIVSVIVLLFLWREYHLSTRNILLNYSKFRWTAAGSIAWMDFVWIFFSTSVCCVFIWTRFQGTGGCLHLSCICCSCTKSPRKR